MASDDEELAEMPAHAGPQTLGKSYDEDEDDLAGPRRASSRSSPKQLRSSGGGTPPPSPLVRGAAGPAGGQLLLRLGTVLRVLVRLVSIGGMLLALLLAVIGWPEWLTDDDRVRARLMSLLFLAGLIVVALEDVLEVSKSAIMLLLAAVLWTMLAVGFDPMQSESGAHELHHELNRGLRDVGSVVLFLLPAMGVVESIDHFHGFALVTHIIQVGMRGQKGRLMPIICILTFFLSSVIDNLTSTIVALKILRHIVADDPHFRKECGCLAVMAANAGGAWSPIGDVTTTMLWIQGKITAPKTVMGLLFPSFVAGVLPLAGVRWQMQRRPEVSSMPIPRKATSGLKFGRDGDQEDGEGRTSRQLEEQPLHPGHEEDSEEITVSKVLALGLGIFVILLVPFLKMWTGLPPYLGMLLALGLMWLVTDLLGLDGGAHEGEGEESDAIAAVSEHRRGVVAALRQVDLTGLLFFTGVLLSVGALDSAGVLRDYATFLVSSFGTSPVALCTVLGISSAVVDNVPLVEASIDMFRDTPTDDALWQLIALAAGTGGSILSVGSIAGVTLMSMEGVGFLWYCRHASLWSSVGFFAGIASYQLQHAITG